MSGGAAHRTAFPERLEAAAPFLTLVRREFVRLLRGTRPFVFLLLLVCVAGVLVTASYPPANVTPVVMGSHNERMVISLVVTMFVAAMLLLPAYGAASIQSERSRNTYDLLALSLIRPSGVVFAKIISTLGYFCFLIVAVLPFLGVSFFLVGVDWQTVIQSGIIILIAAITCATVGVLASAICRGPIAAVLLGYVATLFFTGGYILALLLLTAGMLDELADALGTWANSVFMSIILTSPICAIAMTLAQGLPWWSLMPTGVLQALVWAFAVVFAARQLRKPVEPPQPLEMDESLEPTFTGAPRISSRMPPKPIQDGVNPVRYRELRWGIATGGDRGLAIVGLVGIALLVLEFVVLAVVIPDNFRGHFRLQDAQRVVAVWMGFTMVTACFLTPGLASVTITTERDRDALDALRMTTLSPRRILWGKTSAVLRFSIRPLLISGFAFVFVVKFLVTDLPTFIIFATGIASTGITILMCTAIGVWASVRARSTPVALLAGYALSGLVVLAPVLLHNLLETWTYTRATALYESETLLLTPVTLYVEAATHFIRKTDLPYVAIWFICSIFHLAGIALIYYLAERRFVRMVTRDE